MLRNNSHDRWFWTWEVRRVFPNGHLDGMVERSTGERISFVIRKLYQRVLWYINWICALILYTLKLTKKYWLTTSKAPSSPVEDYHVLKKVGSDILNEGVCRDKLFPMDHSMYGKLENPFPGLINLGIRRRLANGKNQNETEHWAAALIPATCIPECTHFYSNPWNGSLAVPLVAVFPARPFNNFPWISDLQVKGWKST